MGFLNIQTLQLVKDEDISCNVYIVKKGWTLHFLLDPVLDSKVTTFYCNHPVSASEEYNHETFHNYQWTSHHNDILFPDSYAQVEIKRAGVFKFYLESENKERCCNGFFIVQPDLYFDSGNVIDIQSVTMQTVLTKCLGKFAGWKGRLQVARECNYNTIHFTPIQELGESNSSYSIRDHHRLDPRYGDDFTESNLEAFVLNLHKSWNMFSIVDVVWNHVANDCKWITEHPEASYNLVNTPHLRPAFLVDRLLWYFNKEIIDNQWKGEGLPNFISEQSHLESLEKILRKKLLDLRLEEFYMVDIKEVLKQFEKEKQLHKGGGKITPPNFDIIQDSEYKRLGSTIDLSDALASFADVSSLKTYLEKLNQNKRDFRDFVISKVTESTLGHIRYHFLDLNGPKYGAVTEEHSIAVRYFCYPFKDANLTADEELVESPSNANLIMAHNGWVAGGDILKGFVGEDSHVFLCRELFAWGDSIKLRYGDSPDDVPFLWEYMKQYTEQMARIFHGVRLDNCHNTPLHVAEYLLDCARKVRPDLFVIAELFTGDEKTDNIFVNRLGINSMIRENMGAFSPHDLGRHIHRYGGPPTGSFMLPNKRPLKPSVAPALFMDITHDNESLMKKRSIFDFLPSCALVAAGSFATGSTRGYDDLVPHYIHVVEENRLYQTWCDQKSDGSIFLGEGLINARQTLNAIHTDMKANGFEEIFVDQMTKDVVAVTRHCPRNHQSIIIVGHCCFSRPAEDQYPKIGRKMHGDFPPLKIEGHLEEILFEGQILEKETIKEFVRHKDFINGNENVVVYSQKNIQLNSSNLCTLQKTDRGSEILFRNFFPGSVVIFKVSGKLSARDSINCLRATINTLPDFQDSNSKLLIDGGEGKNSITDVKEIVSKLSLVDLNKVLYRSSQEEGDDGFGGGVYNIPGHGDIVYCGLQGIMSVLSKVAEDNDLGHPICSNLREGDWLLGYTANRLKHHEGTKPLGLWFENIFDHMSVLPRFLVPSYFEVIVRGVHSLCIERSLSLLSRFVQDGATFTKHLSMASVQLCGEVKSARLPSVEKINQKELTVTLAAGLPHFSTGFMRCWGRDTFIALRGLMLITGRFDVARTLILAYAGCVRHGLAPNLLASGTSARFNARDATWFWLQAVQEYCKMVDEGVGLLNATVLRMYPTDDSEPLINNPKKEPLHQTIHEILTRHYNGISFKERNAGIQLDRDMSDQGFFVEVSVDELGFVRGGSEHNCGTWMDKMGGSEIAKNKGVPATPRCGSPVEIIGLCKSTLHWLVQLHGEGKYPHDTIRFTSKEGDAKTVSYSEWESKIQENFDVNFFIGDDSTFPNIHKRNIYKDTLGSNHDYLDHQLRPNYPIAMCVAPGMFDAQHAWKALESIEQHLLGPLGLRTLDPDDWNYDGDYENHLDNADPKKAKGFNYHNGPEWVWVLGPFLRARLIMAERIDKTNLLPQTISKTREVLSRHKREIETSPWKGLTELTNKDGAFCSHSCPTQAWSSACLLEVLYDLQAMID